MNKSHSDNGSHSSAHDTLEKSGHVRCSGNGGTCSGHLDGGSSESWGWEDETESGKNHGESWTFHLLSVDTLEGMVEVREELSEHTLVGFSEFGLLGGGSDVTLEVINNDSWLILHLLDLE
jgi:hypothetical protein|tara:strand:+ start:933 stop:1295 length:363 start_codon:yes stop_codon:yes gene_type:complete